MLINVLFYLFASILIGCALSVVMMKNPVVAVLALVGAFVASSGLWLMLNVEFLALTLILVYVGAVMVLFLFVVMMLDIDTEKLRKGFWRALPLGVILALVVLVELILVLTKAPITLPTSITQVDKSLPNANILGQILYTQYSYPVELASLILLLGLVVAVALSLRKTDKNVKYQKIKDQVNVQASSRLQMVKMASSNKVNNNTVGDNK